MKINKQPARKSRSRTKKPSVTDRITSIAAYFLLGAAIGFITEGALNHEMVTAYARAVICGR